jgi:hypothetical protein
MRPDANGIAEPCPAKHLAAKHPDADVGTSTILWQLLASQRQFALQAQAR